MSASSSKPRDTQVMQLSATDVVANASFAIFGKPLVVNVWRALLVESMIDLLLPSVWTWCATDYAGWDFQHADGIRLEVKQTAARQSWKATGFPRSRRFDIAPRTGAWDGAEWIPAKQPMRHADLYVLAYHPVIDDTADHRDPSQWEFYVVPTTCLPATRSVAINGARSLAASSSYAELASIIDTARRSIETFRTTDQPPGLLSDHESA